MLNSGFPARMLAAFLLAVSLIFLVAGSLGEHILAFDMFSHFRMHLAGTAVVSVAALALRRFAGLILLLGTLLVPLAISAQAHVQPVGQIANKLPGTLSVLTFNSWLINREWKSLEAYIRKMNPDLVVLIEFGASKRPLLKNLKPLYPWQVQCSGRPGCHIVLLSRYKWVKTGVSRASRTRPALAWVQFGPRFHNLTLIGTHLVRPPHVKTQKAQIDALAAFIARFKAPVVAAGDFNATPWSAMFRRFVARSGLRAVTGSTPTWPVNLGHLPQLPIDHVFGSPNVRRVGVAAGPRLGSDHLPVFARVRIVRAGTRP